ncbi:hypothetical protein [Thalassomonas actiniarum]|uniref:DUF4252 domain-containing protein n=1 Tax=Thalassomonas actiniarum TaxID=485447 RepID=A0AAE9YUF1_9GAMM|nr:hypothetical protein [Thalassomonas actiniarum]WDD99836.1 hypothetical protein SG35_003960 [Thalassomonas actiniarum]
MTIKYCRPLLLFLIFFIASCATHHDTEVKKAGAISISGLIKLPLLYDSKEYFIDDGPLFVMNKSPLAAYRVIDKQEIEFLGSSKSVYDFFIDAYHSPKEINEISFAESLANYNRKHTKKGTLEFLIYEKNQKVKIYVIAKELDFAVEATLAGNEKALNSLLTDTVLSTGA